LNIIENYHTIYKKLNDYFNGDEKYKFINYLKQYIQLNYSKPLNDSKYLLSFIYNNNKIIEGYDSFLTFAYINVLNKVTSYFYINGNKYENTLPTLDIYDFFDMKNIKLKMSQKQEKMVSNLLKDKKKLLTLLLKRYEPQFIKKKNTKFILNKQILDYLSHSNLLSKQIPIIDFDKYLNDDAIIIQPSNNDDIETNLLYYASLDASNNVYVKLIKYYLLGQRKHLNKKLLDFSLYQICNINKDLDKSKIETKLIKELSNANIEIDLKVIKEFIQPKCDIKTIINETIILELLSYYYKKISFYTMIRYLSKLYEYDNYHKLQIQIQDLIEPSKLIKGGQDGDTLSLPTTNKISNNSSIYQLLTLDNINKYEECIQKIIYILDKKLINKDDIQKKFDETINFKINEIIESINKELINSKNDLDKLIKKQDEKIKLLNQQKDEEESKYSKDIELHRKDINNRDKEINAKKYAIRKEDEIKDTYLKKKDEIEIGIEKIKGYDNKLDFNNSDNYTIISKEYLNFINILEIVHLIPDNNNIKDIITKILQIQKDKIDKFKKEIDDKKTDFDDKIKKSLEPLNATLKEFFDTISDIPTIDDGIIKNLKKTYRNPDLLGNFDNDPIALIADIAKKNGEILTEYSKELENISKIYTDKMIYKVNDSERRRRGGGISYDDNNDNNNDNNHYKKGGKITDNNDLDKNKKTILNELNNISAKLKKFKANQQTNKNVETKMASVGFIDEAGSNEFDRLINTYDDNIKNKNMPYEVARNIFYSKAKNLNLDPSIELEITQNDKIIFCAVIYVIRLLSLYICSLLINNNTFTALTSILKSYVLWYIVILLIFVVIINIDAFKLRILINYLNMHINSFGILVHIILMLIFVYLIYLMTINILGNDQPSLELTENEKIKLKYKLELLTAIVFIFICILVFII
jgi:hypothetical protein